MAVRSADVVIAVAGACTNRPFVVDGCLNEVPDLRFFPRIFARLEDVIDGSLGNGLKGFVLKATRDGQIGSGQLGEAFFEERRPSVVAVVERGEVEARVVPFRLHRDHVVDGHELVLTIEHKVEPIDRAAPSIDVARTYEDLLDDVWVSISNSCKTRQEVAVAQVALRDVEKLGSGFVEDVPLHLFVGLFDFQRIFEGSPCFTKANCLQCC
mmetsp:Transcript_18708/g.40115  ORF Transcript_18708/g.40115 Transcript_18708/m.40115 type:complete len:211 (+) Transcript_18708:284-916(+)